MYGKVIIKAAIIATISAGEVAKKIVFLPGESTPGAFSNRNISLYFIKSKASATSWRNAPRNHRP